MVRTTGRGKLIVAPDGTQYWIGTMDMPGFHTFRFEKSRRFVDAEYCIEYDRGVADPLAGLSRTIERFLMNGLKPEEDFRRPVYNQVTIYASLVLLEQMDIEVLPAHLQTMNILGMDALVSPDMASEETQALIRAFAAIKGKEVPEWPT